VPGPPTTLVASAVLQDGKLETESVEINWTPPEKDGGSPVTSYEISQDGGIVWKDIGENNTKSATT